MTLAMCQFTSPQVSLRSPVAHVGCAGQCSQAREPENDFGLRVDWGVSSSARGFSVGLWSRLQPLAVVSGDSGPNIHPLPLRAGGSCGSPLHCVRIARRMDARRVAIVFGAYCNVCWTSVHDERVRRGRFGDVSLRLRSMFAHRCIVVCSVVGCCTCYAGMWVSCL